MRFITVVCFFLVSLPGILKAQTNEFYLKALQKADSLLAANQLDEAELTYRQAMVFEKQSVKALKGLGKVAFKREDWPVFREYFTQILELNPDDTEAVEYLKQKSKVHQEVVAGDERRDSKNYDEAEAHYKKAIAMDNNYADAYKGLGKIAYETSNWDDFNKFFKRVLQIDPDDTEASKFLKNNPRYHELLQEAQGKYAAMEFEASKKLYEETLDINPASLEAQRGLGRVALQTKKWGDVKDRFGKIIKKQPEDIEANYCLGIAHRETGKFKASLLKKRDFNKSRDFFKLVVDIDSTYSDVYYQRAILEKFRERWFDAVEFAQRQVAVKPDLPHCNTGVLQMYNILLKHESSEKIDGWLKQNPGDFSDFLKAEKRRVEGNIDSSKAVMRVLLEHDIDFSKIPIYFSLARIAVEQEQLELADEYFKKSLSEINSLTDAEYFFNISKYVFSDYELETYLKLSHVEHKKVFYRSFWAYRNPSPASSVNARLVEHFRRLNYAEKNYWYDGVRSWANNPDKSGQLNYPAIYDFNKEFNDKGLIYVRHGQPDDIAVTPNRTVTNESWIYYARQGRPKMIFHFIIDENLGVAGNWQLTPLISDSLFLRDRLGWDKKIDRLYLVSSKADNQSRVEANALESQITDESRKIVEYSLSSDYHTWNREIEPITIPYHLVMQRGFGNKTLLEVYCNIPLADLKEDGATGQIFFKQGAGVYDRSWERVTRSVEKVNLASEPARIYADEFMQKYDFYLEPGTYHLSFFTSTENENKMGALNLKAEVPSFAERSLMVSDIIPAYEIADPDAKQAGFLKNNVTIVPNPKKEFSRDQPLFVYYEIYNLIRDEDGHTKYKIETQMTLVKKEKSTLGKVFGFLGGDKKSSITIEHEREGRKATASEFGSFDVNKFDKGEYLLTVTINDLVAGESRTKDLAVVLN